MKKARARAPTTTAARLAAAAMLIAAVAAAHPAEAAAPQRAMPSAGRYHAQLCVATTTDGGATCGPAEAELRAGGAASVRVADVVYLLKLHSSQVEVVLMQGAMQLDEFVADYEWAGRSLRFSDREKNARYEVRFGARR